MKIKAQTREKYSWFLSKTREDEPRPLERIPLDELGLPAIECFHARESWGERRPCCEPELLERYIAGKEWHGVTVAMVAEDFAINRIVGSAEIKEQYPGWVADEIFAQARKIALTKIGFVPTFIQAAKCYSEYEPKSNQLPPSGRHASDRFLGDDPL